MRQGRWSVEPDGFSVAVLSASRLHTYESGRFIFYTGDDPGGMFGIVDGGFGLMVPSAGGDMLLCNILRRGYWFGYGPSLGGAARKVTVKAVERSHLLHFPLRAMTAICAEKPEFLRSLGSLSEFGMMMNALQVVGDLLMPSGDRRIAAVLARIAKPYPADESQELFPIRIAQAEIGQMSNASRDRVNRALAKFEAAGWLTTQFKKIVITNMDALERFAGGQAQVLPERT
jgi:CRP/FNR family transcriptional regulator, cyclic AMP receptor protein